MDASSHLNEVYTHVYPDGTNHTFSVYKIIVAVTELLKQADNNLDLVYTMQLPVQDEVVEAFRQDKAIEDWRVDRLVDAYLEEPILVATFKDDDEILLIDGHHRYARRSRDGDVAILAMMVSQEVWGKCLLTTNTDMTQEEIRNMPSNVKRL